MRQIALGLAAGFALTLMAGCPIGPGGCPDAAEETFLLEDGLYSSHLATGMFEGPNQQADVDLSASTVTVRWTDDDDAQHTAVFAMGEIEVEESIW